MRYLTIFAIIFIVECSSPRDKFNEAFTKNCQYTLKIQNPKEACECIAITISDRFSDDELEKINNEEMDSMHLIEKVKRYQPETFLADKNTQMEIKECYDNKLK